MIRLGLILTFVLGCTTPLCAQTISVRSGEHADFTRFVLRVPRKTGFTLDRSHSSARLSVEIPNVRFETDKVFSRIPRTRVTSLTQSKPGAALHFDLNCDCDVTAQIQGGTLLVVDVRDTENPAADPLILTKLPFQFHLRPVGAPRSKSAFRLPTSRPLQTRRRKPTVAADPTQLLSDAGQIAGVNKMEQRLLDQIRRASEQGLVRDRAGSTPTVETGAPTLSDDANVEPVEVQNKPADTDSAPASISVTTSIDRDLAQIADVLAQVGPDAHCMASETVALNQWGDDQPFGAQIAKWRAGLLGEFDQPNPDAIIGLTRTYLHFGFGAEAARTVSLLPAEHPERDILTTLAALLDAEGAIDKNAFSNQESCDSDTAMWSVISAPEAARSANNQAILRAFSRLPVHLRPHVGPRLSRIFSDAGNVDMAESILRPVERTSDEADPEIAMAQAATAELRGDHETAAQHRQTVAETGSEQAPLALIELVEQAFRNGTTLTPDTPELTASYASEFKRSTLGPDLRRTDALAWAITGDFARAFDRLSDIRALDGDDAFDAARHPVLALMPERANDMTFLQFGLLQLQTVDRQIPEDIGNPMARRFLGLGFSQAAVQVLTGTDLEAASPERRLLRAEAALAEGLPHQALVSLLGLDGETAANLRAEAFLQTENFQGAAHMLAQVNQQDAANRSLWLASEWQSVLSDSDGPYGQIAQMSRSLVVPGTEAADAPPLAQAKALIDESQTARSEISALLQQLSLADRAD